MKETIQVNPNNIEEIKDALITAMQLSDEEPFKIIQTLKRKIENYDIHYWIKSYMNTLNTISNKKPKHAKLYTSPKMELLYRNGNHREIL